MNPNLENPFRNQAKRATKRLFKAGDKGKIETIKVTKENIDEKMKQTMVKYGPYKILYPQVQFLKQLEKLIPIKLLEIYKQTAKDILIATIKKIDKKGNILVLQIDELKLDFLPELPTTLNMLDCTQNQLTSLPDLPPAMVCLFSGWNNLRSLPELPPGLRELSCWGNKLSSLPKLPDSLQELSCSGNQLTNLPDLPESLQVLDCALNKLINLPKLPASLLNLKCRNNLLTSLPDLPASLGSLDCSENSLTRETQKRIQAHKNYDPKNFKF